MPAGTERSAPRAARPHSRRALYAATVLAPLSGLALFAVVRGAGVVAPAVMPVQPAEAQQVPSSPPAPEGVPPLTVTTAPAAENTGGGALGVLIQQANFWRARQRYDQAITSLQRALMLAPDDADALALMAQVQSEKGDQHAAAAALERLRQVAPGDARIPEIEQTIRIGPITQDQLAEARRLALAGKQAEAVARYNSVFKGNPPPDALAVEYYQTLAGAEGGYDPAREGLARLVRQNPQDLHAQLAYAQVLTYRDAYRVEGIQRLAALAQNPAVAEQATQAWRQALGWLPDTKDSVPALQDFLIVHPGDAEIANKMEQAKNPVLAAAPPVRARIQAFEELNKGQLADAEKLFQQAIEADANDADAIGGLGIVRLRQRKFADAKTLLARAIALDPQHKGRWQQALDAASNPGGGPNPAVALINRGNLPAAERELHHQIAKGGDVVGLQAMLADAQARQGRLDEAEATYRAALARAPNNAQVLVGLAGVLSREGRGQEASALLDRAQSVAGNSRQVGQARALQLREQASAVTDPATQVGLYRAAVAADPDNPWLKLDLARALFRHGETREARGVMAEVIGTNPTPDALKAGIIFANETSDPDAAAVLIARLPPSMRTADMRALQMRADLQRQIGMALGLSRPAARQRLLDMAAVRDPDGGRGAALARALGEIGDRFAAREAIVAAQASTPNQGAAAKLRYAGALMDIGDAPGAQDMLAQIGSERGLDAGERQQLLQMQAGLAVRASDRLNEQGRQADAYDRLAPYLARAPGNTDLNLALARLYQGARNPQEALQISRAMLRRDPRNVEARRGAVESALQLGDRGLADTLVREGQQIAPNDPRTWIMSADLEKARGNNGRALQDLERARGLRLQQLGYSQSDTGTDAAPAAGVSLAPGSAPVYRQANPQPVYRPAEPSADGGADQPQDFSAPASTAPFGQSADQSDAQPPPAIAPTDLTPPFRVPGYRPQTAQAPAVAPYQPSYPQPYPAASEPAAAGPANPFATNPAPAPAAPPPQGYYANPFRQDLGAGAADTSIPSATPAPAPDAETAEIDKSILALRDAVAPSLQAGFGFRERSGDSGLDRLSALTIPLEATFSPGGTGQLKLAVTPTMLDAGSIAGDITQQQRFGTSALGLRANATTGVISLATPQAGDQNASGLGLDVSYKLNNFSADLGSSPYGFREENILGGVEWAPALSDHVRLRLRAERRALPDSLLSFAGAVDPRTGETWGAVVQDHARATLEFSSGRADFYLLAGGAEFTGTHVLSNTEIEAGAGGSVPIWRTPSQELRMGLDLIYFGFDHNEDFFTLGQGGYFSPQSFLAALVPVTYKEQVDENLSYEVGGSAGYASFRQDGAPYYPIDPALQAQLEAQQSNPATAVPGVLAEYAPLSRSGFSGTAHGTIDYRVTPSLHLGGNVNFATSPAFNEMIGLVYAKYLFNGVEQ